MVNGLRKMPCAKVILTDVQLPVKPVLEMRRVDAA